ncbi:Uu.00g139870.m01.CDS01 [Anthostomella pinea]|uniref:Uu.00g139870.m01.CDS01 n=1 Tax=Anthostomella pinea TaxID=933095 RepID=A0AAI8VQ34_9PEZI|nr:Uu.00g139870.m01.CDS01 [Anthostomella pinea]
MHFSTTVATALLGASAVLASPSARKVDARSSETVAVTDFFVHEVLTTAANSTSAVVDSVAFTINAVEATNLACFAETGVPSEVVTCGDSKYRFALYPGTASYDSFALRLYHETGLASGRYGEGPIPVYCHAGGGEALACSQVITPVHLIIDSD